MSAIASDQHRDGRAAHASSTSRASLGPIFAQRANEATDEDKFVADNFALLKSSGLVEAGVPVGAWRRRRQRRRARRDAAHARLSLRLDRAGLLDAHAPGRHSGLALDASEGGGPGARAAAQAHREGAHHPAVERRLGLDRRLRQGREGRRRLSHHRAQDLFVGRAGRRPPDDRRGARKRRRAADGAAFRHPDELAAREGARHLAHARHARHRFA